MSLLTDTDLRRILCSDSNRADKQNKLQIFPFSEESLTPVGYDLRVGSPFSSTSNPGLQDLADEDVIKVKPGDTALISTLETINMPHNRMASALICSKVSKVSKGLSHISTTIDPDWEGPLLIAVHNTSRNTILLKHGEKFCTAVFFENKSPSTKECDRQPGRLDIFMRQWMTTTKKTKRMSHLKKAIPPLIVVLSFPLGHALFGNTPGLAATITGGVALSQIIKSYLD